jgi:DNA polymerase elongation subunit (family B)
MPDVTNPQDKVFQISVVIGRNGETEDHYLKYLLSLKKQNNTMIDELDQKIIGEDAEIRLYDTESNLLLGFTELVREIDPQVIIGYNIFVFDIPYLFHRAELERCRQGFCDMSCIQGDKITKLTDIKWSSGAFGKQEYKFIDTHGRLWIDLLPVISRDYKLNNYRLSTVCETFLKNSTKDPLTAKGIFKCYRDFTIKSMSIVGKYCIQDSFLVLQLFEKLQIWITLVEMSRVCNTPIFVIFTKGQQIKMYSQMYQKCVEEKVVINSSAAEKLKQLNLIEEDEKYTGAYVFPPVPGV